MLVINPNRIIKVNALKVCFIAELIVESTIRVASGTKLAGISCGLTVCIFST